MCLSSPQEVYRGDPEDASLLFRISDDLSRLRYIDYNIVKLRVRNLLIEFINRSLVDNKTHFFFSPTEPILSAFDNTTYLRLT